MRPAYRAVRTRFHRDANAFMACVAPRPKLNHQTAGSGDTKLLTCSDKRDFTQLFLYGDPHLLP